MHYRTFYLSSVHINVLLYVFNFKSVLRFAMLSESCISNHDGYNGSCTARTSLYAERSLEVLDICSNSVALRAFWASQGDERQGLCSRGQYQDAFGAWQ